MRIRVSILAAAMMASVLSSCSVKEVRTECPCRLYLDYSLLRENDNFAETLRTEPLLVSVFTDSECLFQEDINVYDWEEPQRFSVPKGSRVYVSCILGKKTGVLSTTKITIPEGRDSDRLYGYGTKEEIGKEQDVLTLYPELDRQYTNIKVIIAQNVGEQLSRIPYRLTVCSGVTGLDIIYLQAVEGRFRLRLEDSAEMVYSFNMPRQNSEDIYIAVENYTTGRKDVNIPLGRMLAEKGYDYARRDLPKSAVVTVDFLSKEATLEIEDWVDENPEQRFVL